MAETSDAPAISSIHRVDAARAGVLIVNADDWGRDYETTQRIYECFARRTISSASAMVFMDDSERAAEVARAVGIDIGLHINFTTLFVAPNSPGKLLEHQRKLMAYLLRHTLARVFFHPGLAASFEYVLKAQIDEFHRLYGAEPKRYDGHHHMHLCANVLMGGMLPDGAVVRRNFSFERGEKSFLNRKYRQTSDILLARKHRVVDYFLPLVPLEPKDHLEKVLALARKSTVEMTTHPINQDEFRFLVEGELGRRLGNFPIAPGFIVPPGPGRSTRFSDLWSR